MAEEYLLPFAVEGILAKLTSLAAQEISLESGFKAELSRLRRSLSTIRGFLGDVACHCQPPGRGKALENWVKKLKHIAGDADDVLDDLHYEVVRRKVEKENHTKNKVLKFFSVSNPIVFRLKMERKIRKMNASLVVLKTKASIIGLVSDKIDATPCGIGWERQTNSLIATDERMFGRKEDLSNIITTLTNSNITQGNIGVLAVVGMPGIGKTTLAKSVYLADPIDRCFDRKIWVSVSHPFDINSILSRFLELLNSTEAEGIQRQNALLKKLREELKGIRYLLVLDDIWDED